MRCAACPNSNAEQIQQAWGTHQDGDGLDLLEVGLTHQAHDAHSSRRKGDHHHDAVHPDILHSRRFRISMAS